MFQKKIIKLTTKMKKIFLLLAFTNFCFSQTIEKNYSENLNYASLLEIGKKLDNPIEKFGFYKHLFLVSKLNDYKKDDSEFSINKDDDSFIYKILKDHVFVNYLFNISEVELDKKEVYDSEEGFISLRKKLNKLDNYLSSKSTNLTTELHLLFMDPICERNIEGINDNFIYIYGDCGTGASIQKEILYIKGDEIIDIGHGVDKLSKNEYKKLEKNIRKKVKNYSHASWRSGSEVSLLENGNFKIEFRGLKDDEPEASGGSIIISYETKDLVTFFAKSLKIEEN